MNNLRQIAFAIVDYNSAKGEYPTVLSGLTDIKGFDLEDLKCPIAESGQQVDYIYLNDAVFKEDQQCILVFDDISNHRSQDWWPIHVVYTDLKVKIFSLDSFLEEIKSILNAPNLRENYGPNSVLVLEKAKTSVEESIRERAIR